MVVPEERHLLLQRPPGMDHPEQPALPRVGDVLGWQKRATRGHTNQTWPPNQFVDIVFVLLIIDEVGDGRAKAHVGIGIDLRLTRAESSSAKEVFDLLLPTPWHGHSPAGTDERRMVRPPTG